MHFAVENGRLAGQLRRMIVLREGHLDVAFLIGLPADKLLLKTGDELPGAEGQGVIFRLAALEGLAVHPAFEIKGHGIAHLGRAVLHRHQAGLAVLQLLELLFHIGVGDLDGLLFGFESLVGGQLDLGLDSDRRLELEPLGADGSDVEVDLILYIFVFRFLDRLI